MAARTASGRVNQQHRTRKDLLRAAARLLREGRQPTVAEVAEAAMISRATAYRYFPSRELLLAEAPLDQAVPPAEELFRADTSTDVVERVDRAEAALHKVIFDNEVQLRVMLACALDPRQRGGRGDLPIRQNRRSDLIEAALAPARDRLDPETYATLCAALAVIFGTESMIVFRDVLQLDARRARKVKSWAVRALVRAALAEASSHDEAPRPRRQARR